MELSTEFIWAIGITVATVVLIAVAFAFSIVFANIQIRKEQRFSNAVLQSSAALLIVFDAENQVRSFSKSCERLTGYPARKVLGKSVSELPFLSKEFVNNLKIKKDSQHTRQIINHFKDILISKHGSRHIINWQISFQTDDRKNMELKIGSGLESTELQKTQEQLLAHQDKLQAMAENLSIAEAEERRKIAEELHDRIGATLTVTSIKLSGLKNQTLPEDVQYALEDLNKTITGLLKDIRALTFQLSPPALYDIGPSAAIESLANSISKQHSIKIDFQDDGLKKSLEKNIGVFLYKAVRELLLNVIKHAQAKQVWIRLFRVEDKYRVELKDDGIGFDPKKVILNNEIDSGFGLFNIKNRLEYHRGGMIIDAHPGKGSRFIIEVPIKYLKQVSTNENESIAG